MPFDPTMAQTKNMSSKPLKIAVRWFGFILLAAGCTGSALRVIRSFHGSSSPMHSEIIMVVPVGWLATALGGIALIVMSFSLFRNPEGKA